MKTIALIAAISAFAVAGCGVYPATPEGDAKRASDAKMVEDAGKAGATVAALLPPPFNLIVAGVVGIGATIAAQKISGGKKDDGKAA